MQARRPQGKRGFSATKAVEAHKANAVSQPRRQWKHTRQRQRFGSREGSGSARQWQCLSREGSGSTQTHGSGSGNTRRRHCVSAAAKAVGTHTAKAVCLTARVRAPPRRLDRSRSDVSPGSSRTLKKSTPNRCSMLPLECLLAPVTSVDLLCVASRRGGRETS